MKKTLFSFLFVYLFASCEPARFNSAPAHHNDEVIKQLSAMTSVNGIYKVLGGENSEKFPSDSFINNNFHQIIVPEFKDSNEIAEYIFRSFLSRYRKIEIRDRVMYTQNFSIINKGILEKAFEKRKVIYFGKDRNNWISISSERTGDSIFFNIDNSEHNLNAKTFRTRFIEKEGYLFLGVTSSDDKKGRLDSIDLNTTADDQYITVVDKGLYLVRKDSNEKNLAYNIFQLHFERDSILVDQVSCDLGSKPILDSLGIQFDGLVNYDETKLESMFQTKLKSRAESMVRMYEFPSIFEGPEKINGGFTFTIMQYLLLAFVFLVAAFSLFTSRSNRNH